MPIDASIISQGIRPLAPIDPTEIQARVFGLRNLQQQNQEGALKLQQEQKAVADQRALADAYKQAFTPDDSGVLTLDRQKLTQSLATSGQGDKLPKILQSLDSADKATAEARAAKADAETKTLDAAGHLAVGVRELGYTPDAFATAVHHMAANGLITPQDAQQYLSIAQQDPSKIQALTDHVISQSPKEQELANARKTADARATTAARPTEASLAAAAVGGDANAAAAFDRLKPKPEVSLQAKDVLLDGKPAIANFNPKAGTYAVNGEDVTARVKPIPPASQQVAPNALSDVKEAVAGMKDGTLPPMLPGRATKEYLATMAEAHRQGYDLQAAATDWTATQKHIATMNGAQQLRLNQSINQLPELLDSIDAIAAKWKGGLFPILNKANLALAKGGAYGDDVASVARQLDAQIADVTADLGNVYMGGNSPTDHALSLAAKSLSGEWSQKVLTDMTALARKNVTIRQNSIKNTGVAGASPNNPYASPAAAAAITVAAPNGKTYTFKSQADADAFKAKAGIK